MRILSLLIVLLLAAGTVPSRAIIIGPQRYTARDNDADVIARIRQLPLKEANEVLWLARCIYSESNRPREQELIAWVVRNRVETRFRGSTYRDVVLNPMQFSAFNQPSSRRRRILNLTLNSPSREWKEALAIAFRVYTAPASERPFPITTRHFYSPMSMKSNLPPVWALQHEPLSSAAVGVSPQRFRFYNGIVRENERGVPDIRPATQQEHGVHPPDAPSISLDELRRRIRNRRRIFSGSIERPVRPTVLQPSASGQ